MPAPDEAIDKALECLSQTDVINFTAEPAVIRPGVPSTLRWEVALPPRGCSVQLRLNGGSIPKSGSRTITPSITTNYSISGRQVAVEGPLATVTVTVDTNGCFFQSYSESTLRNELNELIKSNLDGTPISERSPAQIEIDRSGVSVKLRLKLDVPDFFDPNVDVDMLLKLRATNNNIIVSFRSYSSDVDWPWWVTGITLGITEFVDNVLQTRIDDKLKPLVLEKVKTEIEKRLVTIPSTHALFDLTTESNSIQAQICPV